MVTCGIFIHDDKKNFLSVFPYGADKRSWTIPKGLPENSNETYINAAIRECREECNLEFSSDEIILIGILPYLRNKNLCLFSAPITEFPDLSQCLCTSYFKDKDGRKHPEISGHDILNLEKDKDKIGFSMYETLTKNYQKILDEEMFYQNQFLELKIM